MLIFYNWEAIETSKSPENIINEFGGPATLNIQFVRIIRETDDKGEKIDEEAIYSQLAEQIGVNPEDIKSALERFWKKS